VEAEGEEEARNWETTFWGVIRDEWELGPKPGGGGKGADDDHWMPNSQSV